MTTDLTAIARAIRFFGLCVVRAGALMRPISTDSRLSILDRTEEDAKDERKG